MNIKSALNSEVAKFIKQSFPVVKKRTALWFFTNEIKSSVATQCNSNSTKKGSEENVKLSRNRILNIWRKMDPESKRKYFNMAEFDDVRYREQKSQWVSKIGSLLVKHGGSVDKLNECLPTHEKLQEDFLASIDKLHKNYEQMIQTKTTRMLYKDAIKQAKSDHSPMDANDLMSAIPKNYRPILSRPRRPLCAFLLYVNDHRERLRDVKNHSRSKETVLRLASKEWARLDKDQRVIYDNKYAQLRDEYLDAMNEFKSETQESIDNSLEQASRERKAFKRSLRRRLRNSSVLPVSVRNAFNFFLMDNKDVRLKDLTEIWRNLPEEKKMKYIQMNQEDLIRYQSERSAYNEITQNLNDIINKRRD